MLVIQGLDEGHDLAASAVAVDRLRPWSAWPNRLKARGTNLLGELELIKELADMAELVSYHWLASAGPGQRK